MTAALDPNAFDDPWLPPTFHPGTPGPVLIPTPPPQPGPPPSVGTPSLNSYLTDNAWQAPNAVTAASEAAGRQGSLAAGQPLVDTGAAPLLPRPVNDVPPMFNNVGPNAAPGPRDYMPPAVAQGQPAVDTGAAPLESGGPISPAFIPLDQAGFSREYVDRSNPVGGRGEIAGNARGSDYEAPLTEGGFRLGGADVPANIIDQIRQGRVTQAENARTQDARFPLGTGSENTWQKDASGRPTPARMGMPEGQGGLGNPHDQTFQPSNAVMAQALAQLPPIFQQFKNIKISRPQVHSAYGPPTNIGGYSSPGEGAPITVGRGAGDQSFFGQPASPNVEVTTAKHELLHDLSFYVEPYKSDSANDFRQLGQAILADKLQLENAPQYRQLMRDIGGFGSKGDWAHVWTAVADAATKGLPLPPALSSYFAPMMQPVATRP